MDICLHREFMVAYAKVIIGAHIHRTRPGQKGVSRYFNHTAGRFVFARMMLLSAYEEHPHKYTINRIADTLDMSRQATSGMIRECLDAEYIVKCPRRGYFASEELLHAFEEFMELHEQVMNDSSIHEVLTALQTSRKLAK